MENKNNEYESAVFCDCGKIITTSLDFEDDSFASKEFVCSKCNTITVLANPNFKPKKKTLEESYTEFYDNLIKLKKESGLNNSAIITLLEQFKFDIMLNGGMIVIDGQIGRILKNEK